ncbi:MAG: preprotein translocase subunit SecE [Minisyncoccales bacterium]
MNIVNFIVKFLKEVRVEVKKVNWLGRRQLANYTFLVIGFILVTAAFFGSLDYGFAFLLQKYVIGQ